VVCEALDVACERCRVAADIDDARCADLAQALERLAREPGARWVDDDYVGIAAAAVQLCDRLADVPREVGGVADSVQLRVLERARDRLLGDVDAPDRQRI